MSQEEFWRQDPNLFWAYRFAYYRKKKEQNYNLWLQGRYVLDALTVALSNAFSKQKITYPVAPYGEEKEYEKTQQQSLKAKLLDRVKSVQRLMGGNNEQ